MKWYFIKLAGFPQPMFVSRAGDAVTFSFDNAKLFPRIDEVVGYRNGFPKEWKGQFEIWVIDIEKNKLSKVKL